MFSVSPAEFVPGTEITLNATIINPLTNALYTDHNVEVQFFEFVSDGTISSVGTATSTGGIATLSCRPNDEYAHAYNATILNCTDNWRAVSNVVSCPVQLTVGKSITLNSIMYNESASTVYTVEYWFTDTASGDWLYDWGRQVKLKINDTAFYCTTNDMGVAEFTRDFQPMNNSLTTYTITASFDGESPVSASATSTALGDTRYASCTTVQYNGYEPTSDSRVLTVSPQSVQATNSTKTPEEMQQEAKDSGWLSVYNEWSWWYPWYRLHVKIHVNPTIDIGFNPILPGGETYSWGD